MKQPERFPVRRLANLLIVVGAILILVVAAVLLVDRPAPATPEPTQVTTPAETTGAPPQLPAPGTAALGAGQTPAAADTPITTEATVALPATPVDASTEPEQTGKPTGSQVEEPPATGQPNRLVIPRIGLDTPIVDVGWSIVERGEERFTEWDTAENAAGRHVNSALPGEQGNVVLSGHHNTKGEVFRRISEMELQPGDAIYLYDAQGQRFTYVVDEITDPPLLEVGASPEERLDNARFIQPTEDSRVTLVTCWPYWTNTHRVVVVGKLVTG